MNLRCLTVSDCAENGILVSAENQTETKLPMPVSTEKRNGPKLANLQFRRLKAKFARSLVHIPLLYCSPHSVTVINLYFVLISTRRSNETYSDHIRVSEQPGVRPDDLRPLHAPRPPSLTRRSCTRTVIIPRVFAAAATAPMQSVYMRTDSQIGIT